MDGIAVSGSPLLSVTVLNYNYARYLGQCLDSILSQTLRDLEVIIINDCSRDDSLEIIQPYIQDPRVKLVNHEVNAGYVASLIEGCNLSRGKYITVISADDYSLDNRAFEIACGTLEADPQVSFVFSAWHETGDDGVVRHTRRAADHDYVAAGREEFRRLVLSSPVLHSGTVIRQSAYMAVGGYDTRCRYSVDTNMWLMLCSTGKVAYVDRPLYAYRAHANNLSNSQGAFWEATAEMLLGIEAAFNRFPIGEINDAAGLRLQAIQRALVAIPTMDIFAGRLRRGWHGYWQAFTRHPGLTLLQMRTVELLLRTLLGAPGYVVLRRLMREYPTRRRHAAALRPTPGGSPYLHNN